VLEKAGASLWLISNAASCYINSVKKFIDYADLAATVLPVPVVLLPEPAAAA